MDKQALVVGIDNYSVMSPLRYAIRDASETAAVLTMPEYGFDVRQILDAEATFDSITDQVDGLLIGASPVKLFYFSGHGCANNVGAYLVAVDGTTEAPGLSLSWLRERLLDTHGTVVVVLDCCYSGAAAVKDWSGYKHLSEGDLDRCVGPLSEGKILIAACGPHEPAYESENVGHGVFTFHVLEGLMGEAANLQGLVTPMGLFDYVAQRLAEEHCPNPVWKGEQKGLIILGAGFAAQNTLTPDQTGVDPTLLDRVEGEAQRHLDQYLKQVAVPYEQWRTVGFRKASQALEPLLRWFDRHVGEYPELLSRSRFRAAYAEAQARLAQLGALSEGTCTDEGQIVERLGAGAFGTVWKVKPDGGAPVAYKVYHSNELAVKDKVARFERGYRAMNQLDHPHIVKVHRFTRSPLGFYMSFVDGPNLRQLGRLREPSDAVALMMKVAETLQHAHGRNVIHRDVKPENIVLELEGKTQSWSPYLTDFDLAWFSTATQVTKEAFGAIFYAAPEQLSKPSSRAAHSPTTDIYSFGQLCFFAATGSDPIPFGDADNRHGLEQMIGNWPIREAATTFADLYDECTQHEPMKRLKDFRTIYDRLFQVHRLLCDVDPEQSIDSEKFVQELVLAVSGLDEERLIPPQGVRSLSGRTDVGIDDVEQHSGRLNLTIRFTQDHLTLEAVTSHRARQILNSRLKAAVQQYRNVVHKPGSKGIYEVFLELRNISPNLDGVEECRRIITRAIDAVESK